MSLFSEFWCAKCGLVLPGHAHCEIHPNKVKIFDPFDSLNGYTEPECPVCVHEKLVAKRAAHTAREQQERLAAEDRRDEKIAAAVVAKMRDNELAQIRAALDLDADAPLDEVLASIGALKQAWEASNDNVALNAALDADADAHHHEAVVEALIAAGANVDLEALAVSDDPWGDVIDLIASLGGGR